MKIVRYSDIQATPFEGGAAKGVAGRVVIGKNDGAMNFCMRVFEILPGGHTPKHSHDWEHEIFVHSGEGEIFYRDAWNPIKAGYAVFMPPKEEHQIRNSGADTLVFVCCIPSGAPEL